MFLAHLRPGGRDTPSCGLEIEFPPIGQAKLARTGEGVRHKSERQAGEARIELGRDRTALAAQKLIYIRFC